MDHNVVQQEPPFVMFCSLGSHELPIIKTLKHKERVTDVVCRGQRSICSVAFLAEATVSAGAKDAVFVPSICFSGENLPLSGDKMSTFLFDSFGVKNQFFPTKHKL